MKYIYTILFTLALMLFVSCTKDDLAPDTTGKGLTLIVPFTTVGEQPVADDMVTRVPSDPGIDDKLPATNHLYLWVCLQTSASTVNVFFRHYDMADEAYSWTESNGLYTMSLSVALPEISETSTAVSVGRIYAIASSHAITKGELNGIYNGITADAYATGSAMQSVASATFNLLDDAVFTPATALTSDQLRDLYSTSTVNEIHITGFDPEHPTKANQVKTVGDVPVRLYHCAAKADFQWESTSAVTVNSIKIKNLPTTCKIFQPTQNTNADGQMQITTDMSSKWIGRKYVYVFQPYDPSTLTYDVDLEGKNKLTNLASPSAVSGTNFTTWYRIRAKVTNP